MMLGVKIAAVVAAAHAHHLGPLQVERHATAYSPCSSGSHMRDGRHTFFGAVASNKLPMHTLLRFRRAFHGRHYFRVHDTGSAGMQLDVFLPDCGEAKRFGVRTIRYRVVR
jgi:3D (Asp-Asp-Asp) domain-containing protein